MSLSIILLAVFLLGGMFGARRWYHPDRYAGLTRHRWWQ